MRKTYHEIIKTYFHEHLTRTRMAQGRTQSEMAEKLAMDDRSYIDLDHGKTCCSLVTFIRYLLFVCEDPQEFLAGLREALEPGADYAA